MTNPVYDKLRNCYDSIKDEIIMRAIPCQMWSSLPA